MLNAKNPDQRVNQVQEQQIRMQLLEQVRQLSLESQRFKESLKGTLRKSRAEGK
jgi:hypothetical protein